MGSWLLTFRDRKPIEVSACAEVLTRIAGGPAAVEVGPLAANRREVVITGRGERTIVMAIEQWLRSPDDPKPSSSLHGTTLHAATFSERFATWHALRDALAELGCVDATLADKPAAIVDDAEAAGETPIAARLRAEITAALVEYARACKNVRLISPRADDIDAILAAYRKSDEVEEITLEDCQLRALPRGVNRFVNAKRLSFVDAAIDGSALRGIALPKLTALRVGGGIRRIDREDVAGFPDLEELALDDSAIGPAARPGL